MLSQIASKAVSGLFSFIVPANFNLLPIQKLIAYSFAFLLAVRAMTVDVIVAFFKTTVRNAYDGPAIATYFHANER